MNDTAEQQETFDGYIECALWASTDAQDKPLDSLYEPEDIAIEAVASMQADCLDFLGLCADQKVSLDGLDPAQIGHDFWLTRNHHGAGFWDRGLGQQGDDLTRLACSFGSSDLYLGDNGTLYVS